MDLEAHVWDGADDPERFARIWDRVMPEGQEFSPIELVTRPRVPAPPSGAGLQPRSQAVFLRQQILAELGAWQSCLSLFRRGNGALRNMAARKQLRARRLAAAYFVLTGSQFLPLAQARPRPGGIREGLQAEQEAEARYRRAAEECGDGILRTLFLELARENAAHADQLRWLSTGRR